MDETPNEHRRLRRTERKLLKRLQLAVPIGLVLASGLLSMGLIQVMEVPKPAAPEPESTVPVPVAEIAVEGASGPDQSLVSPAVRPDMSGVLGVSLLDHEVQGPPEENRPEVAKEETEDEAVPLPPVDAGPPTEISPVPEPGSALLLGLGLVALGVRGRYSMIASSSTSNVSAAPGGIDGGAPRSP